MNNKLAVDKLINEMIQVIITEVDTMLNKSCLIFKHKTDAMTAKLIARSIAKYSLDWSSDIIRDQVIATLYESMLIVAADFEDYDITFDNPEYMGKVHNLAEKMLKAELIPGSKKDRTGTIIGFYEESVSPIAEDDQAISPLEQLLNGSVPAFGNKEKANYFNIWFDANKKKILTKKQLQFIDGELDYIDKGNAINMRKRITDRVITAYRAEYGPVSLRIATLMDQQKIIESILEAKDFRSALLPYMEESYIIDTIINNVSPEASRAFNTGSNEKWAIREYRIALFKKLGNIIEILENESDADDTCMTKNFIICSKNHNFVA